MVGEDGEEGEVGEEGEGEDDPLAEIQGEIQLGSTLAVTVPEQRP